MTQNFIMRYVANSAGGAASLANTFIDSTRSIARISFRVKDIGTRRMGELIRAAL